jgi:ABC-type nitrate/sulfonate/bicarbonate transport system substrate-binding protein
LEDIMNRRGTRWSALALAGAFALAATACGSDSNTSSSSETSSTDSAAPAELTKVSFQLDWTPNTNHTGLFVAQEQGFYEEAGIELEILPYNEAGVDSLVGSGAADCGNNSASAMIFAVASGLPVTSVLAIMQETSEEIGFLPDAGFTTPADLDGKTYAGFGTPVEEPLLRSTIVNAGGTGEFEVATLSTSAYTAVYSEAADFTIPYMTWEGIEAELTGQPLATFDFQDYGLPEWYGQVVECNTDWLESDPDTAKAFVEATMKGYEYAAESPDEAAQILIDANPGAFTEEELVVKSQEMLASEYMLDENGKFGTQTDAGWSAFSEYLFEQGLLVDENGAPLTAAPAVSSFYTTEYSG